MILGHGCISTASMSDLSKTASAYDFDKLSRAEYIENEKNWSNRTVFEYYLKSTGVDDYLLVQAVKGAMEAYEFKVKILNIKERAILGQRGLSANEWKSVIGVYYRTANNSSEIYIKIRVTQDVTGSWRQDRAMEIGELICRILRNCTESYSIDTMAI